MILTDREIKLSLERDLITIDPAPDAEAYSSTSVDLKLDPFIREFSDPSAGLEQTIDAAASDIDYEDIIAKLTTGNHDR